MKKERIRVKSDPSDDEDFGVSSEGLERGLRARFVRMSRQKLNLSQVEFSKRYNIQIGTLRDWEQARATPPDYAIGYIRLIMENPEQAEDIVSDIGKAA